MAKLNDCYNVIGTNVVESIQEKWQNAELHIETGLAHVKLYGSYITVSGDRKKLEVHSFFLDEVEAAIAELLSITTRGDSRRWKEAIFKVSVDLGLEIEFIWE